MEDIFFIPSKKISLKDLEIPIKKYHSNASISYSEDLYVNLPEYDTYWEFYNLTQDELSGLKIDEPKFWKLIKPKQVIVITHKRSLFNILKPVIKEILFTIDGHICIDFDELFNSSTIDDFYY